jgi:hypothetical protein
LRAPAPPGWYERYGRRIEDARLPEAGPKRAACIGQVGADGFRLLDALPRRFDAPGSATLVATASPLSEWEGRGFRGRLAGHSCG